MKTLFFAFAVAAATLLSGMSAQAGVAINGSFGFATGGVVFTPDPNGAGYDTFSATGKFTPLSANSQTFDFGSAPTLTGGQEVTFATTPTSAPATLTVDFGNYGVFTGALTSYNTFTTNAFANYSGSFTPGSAFPGFDVATISTLNLAFSLAGTSYNVSGTVFATGVPAPTVPEPASMAIFGLGALGFAARRFRRK
jgi:hypothetical protein